MHAKAITEFDVVGSKVMCEEEERGSSVALRHCLWSFG